MQLGAGATASLVCTLVRFTCMLLARAGLAIWMRHRCCSQHMQPSDNQCSCHSSSYTSTSNSTPREKSCGVSCIKDLQQAAALHTRLCQRDSACLSATPLSLPAACQQARLLLKTNLSSNNVRCCVHLQHGSNLPLLRQLSITLQDAGWAAAHMQLCISLHAFLFQIASRHPTNLHRCAAVLQSACHQAMQLSAMATAAPASCSLPAAARSLSSAAPPHQSAVCQRCTCPAAASQSTRASVTLHHLKA